MLVTMQSSARFVSLSGTMAAVGPHRTRSCAVSAVALPGVPCCRCRCLSLLSLSAASSRLNAYSARPFRRRLPSILTATRLVGAELILLDRISRVPKGLEKYDETFSSASMPVSESKQTRRDSTNIY